MICPECGAEYRPGFTHCSDCLVPLVESLPQPEPEPEPASRAQVDLSREPLELVTVFRSGDPGRIALAKSILQSADVPFVTLNEAVQQWVGVGLIGGYNRVVGPVAIQVTRADADDARPMVEDLEKGSAWIGDCGDDDDDVGHS